MVSVRNENDIDIVLGKTSSFIILLSKEQESEVSPQRMAYARLLREAALPQVVNNCHGHAV